MNKSLHAAAFTATQTYIWRRPPFSFTPFRAHHALEDRHQNLPQLLHFVGEVLRSAKALPFARQSLPFQQKHCRPTTTRYDSQPPHKRLYPPPIDARIPLKFGKPWIQDHSSLELFVAFADLPQQIPQPCEAFHQSLPGLFHSQE